jgi:hypothetical protein
MLLLIADSGINTQQSSKTNIQLSELPNLAVIEVANLGIVCLYHVRDFF